MVQLFRHGTLVKTHPRKDSGKQTDLGDYPPEKIAFHMRTPVWCRRQAAGIGPACAAVIEELLAENALLRLRAAQGVIGLAEPHNPARFEAACAKATTAGDPSYRTTKGVLTPAPRPLPRPDPAVTPERRRTYTGPRSCSPTSSRCPPSPASAVADAPAAVSTLATITATTTASACEDAS